MRVWLICIGCVAWMACGDTKKIDLSSRDVWAVVGGDTLDVDMFKEFAGMQKGRTIDLSKKTHRDLLMNELVERRLIERWAEDEGLAADPIVSQAVEDKESEYLYEKVVRKLVGEAVVTERDIRETHDMLKTERRLRQIFVAHSEVRKQMNIELVMKASRSREKAKAIADSVYRALQANPSTFGSLARSYSDDETGQYQDGDLGFLRLDQVEPRFQTAVLQLKPGQVTHPVEGEAGFHILMLVEERPSAELKDLDAHWEYLRAVTLNGLLRNPTSAVRKRFSFVEDSLFTSAGFRIHDTAVRMFMNGYQTVKEPNDWFAVFDSLQLRERLASFDGGKIEVHEIVRQLSDRSSTARLDDRRMKEGLRLAARTRIFGRAGRELKLALGEDESAALQRFRREELRRLAQVHAVLQKVRYTEGELQSHYRANVDRFKALDQVRITEIQSRSQEAIQTYSSLWKSSKDFERVLKAASMDTKVTVSRRPMLQDDKTIERISYANKNLQPGQVSEVLGTDGGDYFLVRLEEKIPGTLLPLEKVRSLVVQDFVQSTERRIRREWMESMKQKYPVQMWPERLDDVYDLRLK